MGQFNPFVGSVGKGDNSYTKEEIDAMLAGKASLDSNGLVPLNQLPPESIERIYTVPTEAARLALTTDEVQDGDTVRVISTDKLYLVIDDSKLDQAAGYQVYNAEKAVEAIADQNGDVINETYLKINDVKVLTQAEYDALVTKTARFYCIIEEAD